MPYVLIAFGALLTVAGARGTNGALFTLLKGDFTGQRSFIWWALSILLIGSLGYIKETRTLANAFLALVLIVLILANRGVFSQFVSAVQSGTTSPQPVPATDTNASGGDDPLAAAGDVLKTALKYAPQIAAMA